MSTPKYILLAWFAITSLVSVSRVGKPAKVLEPGVMTISLVLTGIVAWLVVIA